MAATGHTAAPSRPVGSDDLDVGAGHFSALGSSQRRNDHGSGVVRSGEVNARRGEADGAASLSLAPGGEAVAQQGRATSSHSLSSGGALQAGSSVQAAVGMGVARALLDAALAALQPAEPFSRPSTTSVRPVTPVAGALDIDANQTIPGASTREASKATLVKTSARPVERMFRLSSFRDRLSPTSRDPSPPTPDDPSEGASHRPRFKRRFSRSLTSLQASLLAGNDAADDALGPDGPDEGGKLAKWRAKGKARLIAAFKTPTLESPPTSPEGSPSPFAPSLSPDLGRASSRSRSHSAPLFLPRAPMVPRQVHPQEVVAAAPPREPVDDLAAPAAPFSPLSPPPERRDSPEPYDFTTCPSSPFDEAPPVLVAPQPAVSTSPGLATLPPPPPAYFAVLPRELQLAVFAAVLDVCEDEWRKDVREGRWAGKKASERWSDGRAKGRRELVKLGRVCRAWRALSLDGQLWSTAPASTVLGGDTFTHEGVAAVLHEAGGFVTTLDARGMGDTLNTAALEPLFGSSPTRLAKIDLTGCTSITSLTLSRLITVSPELVKLVVPGLDCVSGEHLRALAMHCPRLAKLDVSRCPNLTAHWLFALPYPPPRSESTADIELSERRGLKSLKASGLAGVDLVDVGMLLHWHPALVTLDLSFSRGLDDSVLERLVVRPQPSTSVGPSQVAPGGSVTHVAVGPGPATRRTYPSLRHLSLSGCKRVTSSGLHHLVGAFPNLEILELSRIGANLRTEGLARFLASCTKLRKLDLEDASETTDEALLALVPFSNATTSTGAPNLTHLLIANCKSLTDGAMAAVALEHGCPKLRVLEADGTAISDRTAKAFVRLAGARARAAQVAAAAHSSEYEPLVASKLPAVLSVLDNRTTGRRLSRDPAWATTLRPRNGQRGYWTRAVEHYHDREPDDHAGDSGAKAERDRAKGVLDECDPARVVVRSFYSHLAVDAARAMRDAREEKEREAARGPAPPRDSLLRSRALSDSQILRPARLTDDEDGRVACVIS